MKTNLLLASVVATAFYASSADAGHIAWQYGSMANASLGAGADMNGAVPFPHSNAWNTDISKQPVDPNSDNLIASIGVSTGLHPDFGSGTYAGALIGIP
ncbi:MAG: hypothetical protein ABSA49_13770, partial [Rhizomicrobium sp.]